MRATYPSLLRSLHAPALTALVLVAGALRADAAPNEDSAPAATVDQAMSDVRTGSLEVDHDGSLNYRLPLDLPQGRRGVHPSLALAYSSTAGNGPLGVGWHLAGLPAIGRLNRGDGVDFAGADTYGFMPEASAAGVATDNRLVATGGGYFHTARESFRRFERYGTCGDGPCYWVMRDGSGLVYYFGGDASRNVNTTYACNASPAGSCVSALAGPGGVREWPLYKVVDLDGNYYQVDWRVLGTALVPSNITYTRSTQPILDWYYTVELGYQGRPDPTPAPESTSHRLTAITVRAYGSELHHYELSYGTSPTTQRSRLTALQKVSPSGQRYPAQTFEWHDGANGFVTDYVVHTAETSSTSTPLAGWESVTGDFNGDGYTDLALVNLASGSLTVRCARGGYSGLGPLVSHGDNGTAFHSIPVNRPYQTRVGDFNADGKDDLVFAAQRQDGRFVFQMFGSSAASCFGRLDKSHSFLIDTGEQPARVLDGDVNGDGFDDLVFVSLGWNPSSPVIDATWITHLWVRTYLGGPGGLSTTATLRHRVLPTDPLQPRELMLDFAGRGSGWSLVLSDFDGDGRSDLAAVFQGRAGRIVFEMAGKESPADLAITGPGRLVPSGFQLAQGDDWHGLHHGSGYQEREWSAYGGDTNGDGKSELLMSYTGPINNLGPFSADPHRPFGREVHYATGTAAGLGFYTNATTGERAAWERGNLRTTGGLAFSGGTPFAGWAAFACDLNGDRRTDLCQVYQGVGGRQLAFSLASANGLDGSWLTSTPVTASMVDLANPAERPFQWSRWQTFPTDVNGDGATDLVFAYHGQYGCYVDLGLGQPGSAGLGPISGHGRNTPGATSYCQTFDGSGGSYFSDLDGDGRGDGPRSAASPDNRWSITPADLNGDGKTDLLFVYQGSAGRHVKYLLARTGTPDLLRAVNNGFGGSRSFTYESAARTGRAIDPLATGPGLPNRDFRVLVTSVTENNGRGRSVTTSYQYDNGRTQPGQLRDRVDLGFARITHLSAQRNQREVLTFDQTSPRHGTLIARSLARLVEGTSIESSTMTYEVAAPFPGTQHLRLATRTTAYAENGSQTHSKSEVFSYDAWGAPLTEQVCRTGASRSYCTTTTSTYNNVDTATRYLISQPRERRVTSGTKVLSWERFGYWPLANLGHRLGTVERWLCADAEQCPATQPGARWVVVRTISAYDDFGNPLTERDALGRRTDLAWDAYSHIHVAARDRWVTNQGALVALRTEYTYDASGRLRFETDRANDVEVKEVRYDDLGRTVGEYAPDGGWVTYRYDAWGTPASQRVYIETAEATGRTSWRRLFFDGDGAVYREEREGDAGTVVAIDHTDAWSYDATLGQIRRRETSEPHLATSPATTWKRVDEEAATGRPRRVAWVTGATTAVQETFTYAASTSGNAGEVRTVAVTNARGYTETRYHDPRDLMIRKVDRNGGMMWRLYDDAGRPTLVALSGAPSAGVGLSWAYDSWGRLRELQDPSLGVTVNEYDDAGQLRRSVDDAGQVTTLAYDELGRVLTRTTPDGTVTYRYDSAVAGEHGWGRLASVVDASGTASFAYDAVGRPVRTSATITGLGGTQLETTSYDLRGRPLRRSLPDGSAITYTYTDGGNLATVALDGTTYVTFAAHDPAGRVLTKQNANGTTSTYTYRPEGYLATVVTTGPGGTELQRLTYDHDPAFNVRSILDQRGNKVMGGVNTDESASYQYDVLDRLTQVSGAVYGSESYEYDQLGNLTRKGNTRYQVAGHQVVGATDLVTGRAELTAAYDGTGNLLEKATATAVWNYLPDADGRIETTLLNGVPVADYTYDPTGRRVRKVYHRSNNTHVSTFYVSEHYEVRLDSATPFSWNKTRHLSGPGTGHLVSITTTHPFLLSPLPGLSLATSSTAGARAPQLALVGLLVLALALAAVARRRRAVVVLATLVSACAGHDAPTLAADQAGLLSGSTTGMLPSGTRWYHTNHLGSTTLVTDAAGAPLTRMVYRPYGELVAESSAGADRVTHKFTGQELDEETGLYDYRARSYDPALARFVAADTLVPDPDDAQSYNRYAYALGNPIRYTDPSGHEPDEPEEEEEQRAKEPATEKKQVEVKKGDTLSSIAAKYLGDPQLFALLAAMNPQITNPDAIFPGNLITIASESRAAPAEDKRTERPLFWRTPADSAEAARTAELLAQSDAYRSIRELDRAGGGVLAIVAGPPGYWSGLFSDRLEEWRQWAAPAPGASMGEQAASAGLVMVTSPYAAALGFGVMLAAEYDHLLHLPTDINFLAGGAPEGAYMTREEIVGGKR